MSGAELARFESVQIGAADPDEVARRYAALLGLEPVRLPSGGSRFQLDRGGIEIVAGEAGPRSIRFAVADPAGGPWAQQRDFHGLRVDATPIVAPPAVATRLTVEGATRHSAPRDASRGSGERVAASAQDTAPEADCVHAIDHVVIRSTDLDRAIRLWRDELGLRLALDREFPARGLRMLFFRSGGVTLEFVAAIGAPDPAGRDALDGIAYQVRDLAACRERLVAAGFDVSPVRSGHKAGTSVATVRSATGGVPTLLLQPAERAAAR
jgi:catechol 2,3-dioxygenase-like lactoylglutathione lyase family enzyme